MSLLLFEGFDFLTTALLQDHVFAYNSLSYSTVTRYGYGGSARTSAGSGAYCGIAVGEDVGSNYIICGVAFRYDREDVDYYWGVAFYNSEGRQATVRPIEGGAFELWRGDTGDTLLDTSSADIWTVNQWHYLEIKLSCTNSSDYEIRVDGATIMSGSGVDLQQESTPGMDYIRLMGGYGSSCYHDDLYLCDDQGSKNNDFLGEVVVRTLLPDGAGTHTEFTPSEGSNYENVDDTTPDDDTTYNSTGVVDSQDSYAMGDLPDSQVSVHGVKTRVIAKKEGAGFRSLKNFVIVNSSKYDEVKNTLSLSYDVKEGSVLEDNPDDSQDWEVADIDAMEVGYQLAAVQSTTTTTV